MTRTSTGAESVPAAQVVQSGGLPEGNLVKLRSRFFGPRACGAAGCRSYDVYFGSASTRRLGAAVGNR